MTQSGKKGEDFAAAALAQKGYTVLARNYHSRFGEVDIIASDKENICFVEVKTRREKSMVGAAQAVTPAKQRKIIMTALLYLQETGCALQPRFDVFCVETGKNGEVIGYDYLMEAFDGEAYEKNY
jgi:putative endonuclease